MLELLVCALLPSDTSWDSPHSSRVRGESNTQREYRRKFVRIAGELCGGSCHTLPNKRSVQCSGATVARHPFRIGGHHEPALDLVSYGRRGPGRPERFGPDQVAQITRTVRRAAEVMVKVSGGGSSLGAVAAHFQYITRKGALELETDDGERATGNGVGRNLVDDWDLEIDLAIDRWDRIVGGRRASTAKLVHNIVLSMPAGTSPQKLLGEPGIRTRGVRTTAPLCPGPAHGSGSSPRASGGQRAQAGRRAAEYPQGGFALLAGAIRAAAPTPGY